MENESHAWQPIDDLPTNWDDLKEGQIEALMGAWHEEAKRLRGKRTYDNFLMRLRRQWAIETGILERLYSLSDGATRTLIEKGLDAAYIGHEDTDRNPMDVIAVIRDQHCAIDGLYDFVSGRRPLGTSYIKELHRTLTEHQELYEARDTLGQHVMRALPKGEWKALPNNVEGPGDFRFEFCPPEHVASEMDRLLEMHATHEEWNVPPYLEAAWMHHRFALVHPFTDGNGRVARCLATLVFLRHQWFPLVVTRSDRDEYIAGLRQADKGDLRRLAELFAALQNRAIREAFSLSEEFEYGRAAISNILTAVKGKFSEIRATRESQKQQVLVVADTLHTVLADRLRELATEISEAIRPERQDFRAYSTSASRHDEKAGYNYYQVIQCAKAHSYYANLDVFQAWADLTLIAGTRAELLFSFHGMGKGSTGVLVCTAMFYTKQSTDKEESQFSDIEPLAEDPFTFTYTEDPTDVERRFRRWIEDRVVLGLDKWRKELGA